MGKRRKKDIDNPAEVLPDLKIEYVDLPQRPYKVLNLDLTDPEIRLDPHSVVPDVRGAVVKIVVRYLAGTEDEANRVLDEIMTEIRPLAHFVRPPEKKVVRVHVKRMEEIKHDQDPLDALEIWLARRPPPKGIDRDEVRTRLRQYLDDLPPVVERAFPHSVALRGVLLEDWMPFAGIFDLAPIPDGLIGLFARYHGQEDRSNRAGKSGLMESILFGNYGEARKLQGDEMYIHEGKDKTTVGLAWEVNDEPYLITRELGLSSRGGTRSALDINQTQCKVGEGNTEIIDQFGMDRKDFVKTCFVQQGDLQTILKRGSGELKADIIRWRQLQIWDSLEAKAGGFFGSARAEHKSTTMAVEVDQEIVAEGRPTAEEVHQLEADITLAEERTAKAGAAVDRARELRGLIKLAEQVDDAREMAAKRSELEKKFAKADEASRKWETEKDELRTIRNDAMREQQKHKEVVAGAFDGICPVDDNDCTRTDEINSGCEAAKKKLKLATKRWEEAAEKFDEADDSSREHSQMARTLTMDLTKARTAEKFLEDNPNLLSVTGYQAELDANFVDEFEPIDIKGMRDQLVGMMTTVRRHGEAVDAVERRTKEAEVLEREAKLLQYLRFLCGKKGIPSMMIEDALVDIEVAVNNILDDLGCDHRLEFQYERELKHPAKTCFECGEVFPESAKAKYCKTCGAVRQRERTDDLSPMVREGNRLQTFDQDSGAGKSLLALATRIAMSQFLGARVLFLDEVCSDLDDYHLPIMIRLLHRLPTMGFKQVFVISHQRVIAEALSQGIWVTRFQNESRSEVRLGAGIYVAEATNG